MFRPWTIGVWLIACSGTITGVGDEEQNRSPTRIIRGVVVDEAGKPVAGADVRTALPERSPMPATTASDGSFRLHVVGEVHTGEFLKAAAKGVQLLGLETFLEPSSAETPEPVRIVVKPSLTVAVLVRDDQGRPVPGAAVELDVFRFHAATTTYADGHATLHYPTGTGRGTLFALKSGVGFDYLPIAPPARSLPAEVTLTLDGVRTVRIQAVDSAGLPASGAEFSLWVLSKPGKFAPASFGGSGLVRARTDDRGIATFDWLPANAIGEVHFDMYPGRFYCPEPPHFEGAAPPAELAVRLLRMTTLRGSVRQADGRPAPNILLRVEGRGKDQGFRGHARSAADGSYAIEVPPDQAYMIAVLDDKHAARTLTGIVAREGQSWDLLDLELIEGTLVRGRATLGREARPIDKFKVTLVQKGPPRVPELGGGEQTLPIFGTTDAEGRYRFRVGPGTYELQKPNPRDRELFTITSEREIVRDIHVDRPLP